MPISMTPSDRYVTQSAVWSLQIGKTLTNRRITQLQKLGYYSNGIAQAQFKNTAVKKRKLRIAQVFAGF